MYIPYVSLSMALTVTGKAVVISAEGPRPVGLKFFGENITSASIQIRLAP